MLIESRRHAHVWPLAQIHALLGLKLQAKPSARQAVSLGQGLRAGLIASLAVGACLQLTPLRQALFSAREAKWPKIERGDASNLWTFISYNEINRVSSCSLP